MRRYNKWAGNPKGVAEDPVCCIVEVQAGDGWGFYQCQRKRGYGKDGLFCKQHSKMYPDGNSINIPKEEMPNSSEQ